MVYQTNILDEEKRKSNQTENSSKNKKINNAYMDIFRKTFDAEGCQKQMQEDQFLCQKYEDLIEHVRGVALNPERDSSPMRKQAHSEANALQPSAFNLEGDFDPEPIPVDDGLDPYALNDAENVPMSESMFPERDAFATQDVHKTLYDLNQFTQIDGDQNSADIEKFIHEGIDLQENESEIPKNDMSDAMSQGYSG